jgi:tetratricopeptide (TPR) repeat protein
MMAVGPMLPAHRLGRVWSLRLLAIALAFSAFVLQVLKEVVSEFEPPRSVNLVLVGVAVCVAAGSYVVQRVENKRSSAARLRTRLLYWPLRTVQKIDCTELGVFYSGAPRGRGKRRAPIGSYVRRDADEQLDALITKADAVLLTGPPAAGKSRSGYEALRRVVPEDLVIAPHTPAGLLKILEEDGGFFSSVSKPAVVWLDDFQDYIAAGLTVQLLARVIRSDPRLFVLATMRSQQIAALLSTPGRPAHAMRDFNDFFETLELSGQATPDEQRRFAELFAGRRMTGGIGETLTAARALVERVRFAPPPAGLSVVRGALDWRRTGIRRAVPERVLRALFPHYVRELEPRSPGGEEEFARGLAWALEPVEAAASLLLPAGSTADPSYDVLDYVVQDDAAARGGERAVPAVTWELVTQEAAEDELSAIGVAALSQKSLAAAEAALSKATEVADSENARTLAWTGLATVLAEKGDFEGAEAALRKAYTDGTPEHLRDLALASLMERAGRTDEARARYARVAGVIAAGDEKPKATDLYVKALSLQKSGEPERAREAFAEAARASRAEYEAGSHPSGLIAALALKGGGDDQGAIDMLELVISGEDYVSAATAATTLAPLLAERGEVRRAREMVEQVISWGSQLLRERPLEKDDAGIALTLAILQRLLGRDEDATESLRVATTANPDFAPAVNQLLAQPSYVLPNGK